MNLSRLVPDRRITLEAHFEFVSRLGSGSTSEVWQVRERASGLLRALKISREASGSWRARWRASTSNELLVGQSLRHSGLVATLGAGWSSDNHRYLLLEYVDGRTLDVSNASGATARGRRLEQLGDLLEAAAFLHAHGWVHRDICPRNVMVESQSGHAKLFDFGQAARCGAVVRVARLGRGTLNYAAPETLRSGVATPAADVFSAGVVAYEMLVGRLPWHVATTVKQFLAGVRDVVVQGSDERARIDPAVLRCLAPDPAQRPADLDALRDWVRRERAAVAETA